MQSCDQHGTGVCRAAGRLLHQLSLHDCPRWIANANFIWSNVHLHCSSFIVHVPIEIYVLAARSLPEAEGSHVYKDIFRTLRSKKMSRSHRSGTDGEAVKKMAECFKQATPPCGGARRGIQ